MITGKLISMNISVLIQLEMYISFYLTGYALTSEKSSSRKYSWIYKL